jgi:crossover junction endodeoxyribonuclease RuvC
MRILGIDPGSRFTGYGIVEQVKGGLLHVDNGCLALKSADPIPKRLAQIYHGLREVLEKYRPDAVAIEEVFFAKNVSSLIKLGEARGVALLAAVQSDLPIFEYAAREVKQALTGYGQATKEQMQKMVRTLLKLPEIAQEDASDALAVAVCHLQSYRMKQVAS